MRLKNYLDAEHISVQDFADRIGVSRSSVHKWIEGVREPRRDQIGKILEITRQAVRWEDFSAIQRPSRNRSRGPSTKEAVRRKGRVLEKALR